MTNKKSRNFVFTLYNINGDQSDVLEQLVTNGFSKTLFFTHEMGENNDNPHIQGFLTASVPNSLKNVKNKINEIFIREFNIEAPNPHVEIAKGTAYQNLNYITKELEDHPDRKHRFYGLKVLPPGKKRDDSKFESYVELLEKGEIKLKDIEREDLAHYQRHESHYLGIYSKLCKRGIKIPSFVIWLSGTTGLGKSLTAKRLAEILDFEIYDMDCHNNFFNHYSGEELSVWDDYRSGPITFSTLLKITDENGTDLNIKGGKVWYNPKIKIFTSPDGIASAKTSEMKNVFDGASIDNKFDQLKRRVSYTAKLVSNKPKSLPTIDNVIKNSDALITDILGTYKQFLIDKGFEQCISKIPNLDKYEPIPVKKLIKEDKDCIVSFIKNPVDIDSC